MFLLYEVLEHFILVLTPYQIWYKMENTQIKNQQYTEKSRGA